MPFDPTTVEEQVPEIACGETDHHKKVELFAAIDFFEHELAQPTITTEGRAQTLLHLATLCRHAGRLGKSLEYTNALISLQPNNYEAHWQHHLLQLIYGMLLFL